MHFIEGGHVLCMDCFEDVKEDYDMYCDENGRFH